MCNRLLPEKRQDRKGKARRFQNPYSLHDPRNPLHHRPVRPVSARRSLGLLIAPPPDDLSWGHRTPRHKVPHSGSTALLSIPRSILPSRLLPLPALRLPLRLLPPKATVNSRVRTRLKAGLLSSRPRSNQPRIKRTPQMRTVRGPDMEPPLKRVARDQAPKLRAPSRGYNLPRQNVRPTRNASL